MADLPTELIAQILSFLPVKSLLRFKCVSKSWCSLIKTPNFIKLHLDRALISNSDRHLLLCDTSFYFADLDHVLDLRRDSHHLSFSELRLPFSQVILPFCDPRFNFVGCCNGVICILNSTPYDIVLYNLFTRSYFDVPKLPHSKVNSNVTLFGFGYDSISDDYKILKVHGNNVVIGGDDDSDNDVDGDDNDDVDGDDGDDNDNDNDDVDGGDDDDDYDDDDEDDDSDDDSDDDDDDGHGVIRDEYKVFSVKTGFWKTIQGLDEQCVFAGQDKHGCLVNEILHYIVFRKEMNAEYKRIFIACFDLRTDTFSVMDYCPPWEHDRVDESTDLKTLALYLSELSGCLSVINLFCVENPAQAQASVEFPVYRADLWVMKEYGIKESWVRLFSLCFSELESHCSVMPIVCSNDGRKVLVHMDCTYFEWYDLASNNAERFTIDGMPNGYVGATVFVGSLVSFGDKLHAENEKKTLPMKCKKKNDVDCVSFCELRL